jgi:hypothetical protein
VLHGVVYRESDGGYDGLGAQARWAERAETRATTRVSWLGVRVLKNRRAAICTTAVGACARWRQGVRVQLGLGAIRGGRRAHRQAGRLVGRQQVVECGVQCAAACAAGVCVCVCVRERIGVRG